MRGFTVIVLSTTLLLACGKEEAVFRENIGKVAFNGTSGVEVGKIVGVEKVNGAWMYRVEREGGIINLPVTNVGIAEATTTEKPTVAAPSLPAAVVDPSLRATGEEFVKRLRGSEAKLNSLSFASNTIAAAWTSQRCSMVEGEIIDLLLSVNRTRKDSPSIHAAITCEGQAQKFTLSGADFQRYRQGKINDAAVLKGVGQR